MLKVSFLNLTRHKARTALSMLGIIIGVASILTMVSIVDGIYLEIDNAISQAEGILVSQGESIPIFEYLDLDYAEKLEKIKGIEYAIPIVIGATKSVDGKGHGIFSGGMMGSMVRLRGVGIEKTVLSGDPAYFGELIAGRNFRSGDEKVAIIGKQVKDDYDKFVNQTIRVDGEKLTVIGIYDAGSAFLDNMIITDFETAADLLNVGNDQANSFDVVLAENADEDRVIKTVNFIYKDELEASRASDTAAQFTGFLDSFRLFVLLVAAISAFVAGVGILNTVLMSVMERFQEIGTLKAIGWTNSNVMKMIVYESMFMGVLGGLAGLVVGWLASSYLTTAFGLNTHITIELVLQAFGFALVTGLVAGIYPAYVASKMNPIDALHSE